jgi:ABC-type sugar transport system ATPase subunit
MKTGFLGFIHFKDIYIECKRVLECLGIGNISPHALIKDLSISQMQMVEIAKALSLNARIIIMDEPTSSITNKETEMLFSTIKSLQKQNVSILYISHRMEEIFEISDNITVLRDGAYIRTLKTSETNTKEVLSLMVGREFNRTFNRACKLNGPDEKPVLEVNNLTYGKRVKGVSFKLYAGEILAITGLVGAGRSEVVQTIFGVSRMDKGEVLLNGKKIRARSPVEMIKSGIGLVPEGRKTQGLFLRMKVKENISMANLPHLCKFNIINRKKEVQVAQEYVQKLRVKTTHIDQEVQYLSGGNQQKTIIARWLLNKPKVLFLDEPTHGVDVGAKTEIYEIINELASQGVGIILISSELPEVLTLADRILVMSNGVITGELCKEDANQEIIMTYATKTN